MASESRNLEKEAAPLLRRFGLVQATALNMSNMIGVGPFFTIPLLMSALGGPQAMLGWIVAVLIAIPDGMVLSQGRAAMPGSGSARPCLDREVRTCTCERVTVGKRSAGSWHFCLSGSSFSAGR